MLRAVISESYNFSKWSTTIVVLVISVIIGSTINWILPDVLFDFSPADTKKFTVLVGGILFIVAIAIFRKGAEAFCFILPVFFSFNFVLFSIGITYEEFNYRNMVGYRPWIYIFEPLILFGFIFSLQRLRWINNNYPFIAYSRNIKFYFVYIVIAGLSIFFATDQNYGFIGLFALLNFIVWYTVFFILFSSEKRLLRTTVRGMLVFIFIQATVSLLWFSGPEALSNIASIEQDYFVSYFGIVRVGGTVGRATLESVLLLMLPVIYAYTASGTESKYNQMALLICFGLGLIVLFLTNSRGVILATLVGIAVSSDIISFIRGKRLPLLTFFGFILFVIIGLFLFLQTGDLENTLLRNTYAIRIDSYLIAWQMAITNPILGVGINNYLNAGSDYGITLSMIKFGRTVHNQYLLTLAETGILGFLSYVTCLGIWWWTTKRAIKRAMNSPLAWFPKGVHGSLVAFCLSSMSDAPLVKGMVMIVLAILVAGISSLDIQTDERGYQSQATLSLQDMLQAVKKQ